VPAVFTALFAVPPASGSQLQLAQPRWIPNDPMSGCFEVPKSICFESDGLSFVMSPPAQTSDLLIWYQFDVNLPIDESGHKNHLVDSQNDVVQFPAGPGILGRGASAAFDGHMYRTVKKTEGLESLSFTVAFWIYLLEDSLGSWRTIFHRGDAADRMGPALLLWPDERRLQARIANGAGNVQATIDSVGWLPMRRWTHITLSCTDSVLRLHMNGIKDGEVILEGDTNAIPGDLHIGRDPWRSGTKAYIDDFRWYGRALQISEIRALTFPSLTGMGTDYVHLGCVACKFSDAVRSCGSTSHMCSLQELFAGGFHTARAMGWLATSSEVWYYNDDEEGMFTGMKKLGLCCAN